MKKQIQLNNTETQNKRNTVVAHGDGSLSVCIDGKWTRRVHELSQSQYLSLLRADRARLTPMEFRTGRSITGSPVIVSRPLEHVQ
jgi:hypothetical protein